MNWWKDTPGAEEYLRQLWIDERRTAREIGKEFSVKYGREMTRNAIIGAVYRMDIGRPNQPGWYRANNKERHATNPRPPRQKRARDTGQYLRLVWSAPHVSATVSFADLNDNHCRFVLGSANGLETMFCGAPRQPQVLRKQRSFYCGYHHQVTHRNDAVHSPRPHRVGAGAGSSTPERVNGVGSLNSDLPGAA